MTRRLLDLFCCAGGSSRGFADAGFEVWGVDKAPRLAYPYRLLVADALDVLTDATFLALFDVVAASPPCQGNSRTQHLRDAQGGSVKADGSDLIAPTRELLLATGKPYVIENVPGAPLRDPAVLCGTMFGLDLYRHRLFESNVPLRTPAHPPHLRPASKAGHWTPGTVISVAGHCAPMSEARRAMGIDWMRRDELTEAIPPAYTRRVGEQVAAWLATR